VRFRSADDPSAEWRQVWAAHEKVRGGVLLIQQRVLCRDHGCRDGSFLLVSQSMMSLASGSWDVRGEAWLVGTARSLEGGFSPARLVILGDMDDLTSRLAWG
jgi:hypothetical protein